MLNEMPMQKLKQNLFTNPRVLSWVESFFYKRVCVCFASNNISHVLFRNHGNLQDVENPLLATINNSKPSRFRTALPQVHTNICYSVLIRMSTINVFISFINAHDSFFHSSHQGDRKCCDNISVLGLWGISFILNGGNFSVDRPQ